MSITRLRALPEGGPNALPGASGLDSRENIFFNIKLSKAMA
jgi:hypothetical protein